MRDLTQGPISGHLVAMAIPIGAGMLAQTLYFLIDLYFVARLGDAALASSASRLFTFMLPAFWLSTQPWLEIDHVWYLSVTSVWLQAGLSVFLLTRVMRQRLM